MPAGVNIPKSILVLATLAFACGGAFITFWAIAFFRSEDPDFNRAAENLVAGLAPLALAALSGWLLHRYAVRIKQAARDPWAALAAVVWAVNVCAATLLAYYFLDDAANGDASYRGYLQSQEELRLFATLAFLVVAAALWAIARSVQSFPAFLLAPLLIGAIYVSEAAEVWLGF